MGRFLGYRPAAAETEVRRVVWADEALDDLDDIHAYIAGDSPAAAARFLAKLHAAGESLRDYPERGRPAGTSLREWIIRPYLIRYLALAEEVHILSIRHSARLPKP